MASFSDAEKSHLRYHFGYPDVDSIAAVRNDVLIVHPYQSRFEYAMDHVTEHAIARVKNILSILDSVEQQLFEANERLQVRKADVVITNPTEHVDLMASYTYWQGRIGTLLNVEPNPMAVGAGARGINARIRR